MGSKSSPSDIINLKLILVSGQTAEFPIPSHTTVSEISKHVFDNWPEEWSNEAKGDRAEVLRLIYQGRFLHGNVTLAALRLQSGKTTVMHLVQRENLPDSATHQSKRKTKHDNRDQDQPTDSNRACCQCCSIS